MECKEPTLHSASKDLIVGIVMGISSMSRIRKLLVECVENSESCFLVDPSARCSDPHESYHNKKRRKIVLNL